jgi:hypothetical protein
MESRNQGHLVGKEKEFCEIASSLVKGVGHPDFDAD